jgi:hypothetical protein
MRGTVCFCTSIPFDTALTRLVTADLSIGVIERDLSARHERARGPTSLQIEVAQRRLINVRFERVSHGQKARESERFKSHRSNFAKK